ncbi:MAG TPA: flagellar biosynthetic protein FliO [Candidatus Eremiobacteraceae bacterium]|nr:flagellar biosynthetic protein FliO [Candidatus Eremiobacteraceae bacterium]
MNPVFAAIARWAIARRRPRIARVVDQVPLHAGAVLHVIDVDDRRLVIATTQTTIRLLDRYDRPASGTRREEGACGVV